MDNIVLEAWSGITRCGWDLEFRGASHRSSDGSSDPLQPMDPRNASRRHDWSHTAWKKLFPSFDYASPHAPGQAGIAPASATEK